jgi:hypothetical protein
MPSAQDCAERLREQAYRTLSPQIRGLEQELQSISTTLSDGVHQLGRKLEALSRIELPTTELVLEQLLGSIIREKDLQASTLILFARALRQQETQEEILTSLLEAAKKYSACAALFVVRGNSFVGWSSRGFSDNLARTIASCSVLRSDCPGFEEVLESGTPAAASTFAEDHPLHFLQNGNQESYSLLPLNVLQRPVALLLAERGDQNLLDALAILVEFAILRLENIALKILYELKSGMAAEVASEAAPQAEEIAVVEPVPEAAPAVSADEAEAAPVSESVAPPEAAPPIPAVAEPAAEPEPATGFAFVTEPAQALVAETASFAAAASDPIPEPLPIQASAPVEIPMPAPEPEPPKPQLHEVRPVPEEEKLHSEAKRFARLLVSEIKLYNEHHVVEGRENRDLYLRLKRDIDRSREMYEKRVSPNVSRKIDYFHDEIIRILGDNDPSSLGSDYPGPRVES